MLVISNLSEYSVEAIIKLSLNFCEIKNVNKIFDTTTNKFNIMIELNNEKDEKELSIFLRLVTRLEVDKL